MLWSLWTYLCPGYIIILNTVHMELILFWFYWWTERLTYKCVQITKVGIGDSLKQLTESVRWSKDDNSLSRCSFYIIQYYVPSNGQHVLCVWWQLLHPLGESSPIQSFLKRNPDGGMHHICIEVYSCLLLYINFDSFLWFRLYFQYPGVCFLLLLC